MTEQDSSRETMLRGQVAGREPLFVFIDAGQHYAVQPTAVVEVTGESVPTPVPFTPGWVEGVLSIRGRIVPIIDLRSFFELAEKDTARHSRVLVISVQGQEFAIWAEAIVGLSDVDPEGMEEPLGSIPDRLRDCSRSQFKQDDNLVYWLDLSRLLEQTRKRVANG